jgi:dephospho-CoA kinase
MATTANDRIHMGLALMEHATSIDAAILRIRLADDPEAIRIVNKLEHNIFRLAAIVRADGRLRDGILDAIAVAEEDNP